MRNQVMRDLQSRIFIGWLSKSGQILEQSGGDVTKYRENTCIGSRFKQEFYGLKV